MTQALHQLIRLVAVIVAIGACSSETPTADQSSSSPPTTSLVTQTSEVTLSTVPPTTTTIATVASTTSVASATTTSDARSVFEQDTAVIMAFYSGWSQAVNAGHDQSERYFAAHLYPALPKCVPGEKVLSIYTAQRDTIQRADEWAISWGPLNGVRPAGRVYEVQLSELESPSHVSILSGVAYVFWNCRGYVASDSFEVDQDVRYPKPLGGSDGAYGSGCSPGSGTLPDGVWFVFLQDATASDVTFDIACLRPDEQGDTWPAMVTNDSHTLRTSRVSPHTVTYIVAEGYRRDLQWAAMAYPQWLTDPPPSIAEELCWYSGCRGAWLYVNDGAITAIVQGVFQI